MCQEGKDRERDGRKQEGGEEGGVTLIVQPAGEASLGTTHMARVAISPDPAATWSPLAWFCFPVCVCRASPLPPYGMCTFL